MDAVGSPVPGDLPRRQTGRAAAALLDTAEHPAQAPFFVSLWSSRCSGVVSHSSGILVWSPPEEGAGGGRGRGERASEMPHRARPVTGLLVFMGGQPRARQHHLPRLRLGLLPPPTGNEGY
jgi:hypothetical protein